jgi:tetratricopeptide (TPR) repeat protein
MAATDDAGYPRCGTHVSADGPARRARCRQFGPRRGPSTDQPVYPSFAKRSRLKSRLWPALAVAVMGVTVLGSPWAVHARGQQPTAADHHNRGADLQAQGKLGDAIAEFRAAIRLKPDYALAHFNLGTTLAARGMLNEAIIEFRAATRLKPDFAEAHSNLGLALRNQGKLDEAIAEFHTAIRLKPDSAEVHFNLGLALRDQGKEEAAVAEFHTARVNAPRGSELARAIERALAASDQ